MSRYLVATLAFLHLTAATFTHPCLNTTTASPTFAPSITSSRLRASDLLPAASPTSSTAIFDLSKSVVDEKVFTIDIAGQGVPVRCVDCSISGSLEVFARDLDDDTTVPANETALSRRRQQQRRRDLDFDWDIPEGSLSAVFPQGFQGHFELSLTAPSTFRQEVPLLSLPLLGVALPGLGKAGVFLSLFIPLELQMTDPAELTFGFNFSIPRNASVAIHFPWLDESTSFGFTDREGLQIDALPVEISIPGLDVTLTTGLRLQLDVGISSSDKERAVKAGATLDLPRVVVKERQLINVDDQCHRLPNTGVVPSIRPAAFASQGRSLFNISNASSTIVGDHTHLAPSIGVNLDLFAEVDIGPDELLGVDVSPSTDIDIFSTAWALPTICIDNSRDAASTVAAVATRSTPNVATASLSSSAIIASSSCYDTTTTTTATSTSTETVTAALGTSDIGGVVRAAQATAKAMESNVAASLLENGVGKTTGCELPLLVAIAGAVAMF